MFEDGTFLETAIQCGEVVWERGLLRKGYSICHGVAGNGYAFMPLFQQTKVWFYFLDIYITVYKYLRLNSSHNNKLLTLVGKKIYNIIIIYIY